MFEGFEQRVIDVGEVGLHVAAGGSGSPLLLLHGFPQTKACWRTVAAKLAADFTVVCPDLRGYGESGKPPGDPQHERYAKRAMARDVVALMDKLGYERFGVGGHDRGALVGFRAALDHPEAVERLAVLDAIPVVDLWDDGLSGTFGVAGFHHYLLAQPPDFPERLLAAAPDVFVDGVLDGWCRTPGAIDDEAREIYRAAFRDPRTLHAVCEDFRAGASADLAHDTEDRVEGRRLTVPVLVLWQQPDGADLPVDPREVWRRWGDDVAGGPLACGHFLPEERPQDVAVNFRDFFD